VALLALVALGATASSASAATKDYSLNIAPPTAPPGVLADMTATYKNLTKTQQLGSANLTPPAGYTLQGVTAPPAPATATIVDGVLQLRELALQPGASLTVSMSVTTACDSGSRTKSWQTATKQSNDFQGAPGNSLMLDAATSSITTTTVGACVPCPEDASCMTSFSQPGSSLNMLSDPDPQLVDSGLLKMRPLAAGQLDCAGWNEYGPGYQYDTPQNRGQVSTMSFPGAAKGDKLEICFGSPVPFDVKPGTVQTEEFIDGVHVFVGLLPNCIGLSPGPCVTGRDAKQKTVSARKGPGDPYSR
jgi:hypothetical protein